MKRLQPILGIALLTTVLIKNVQAQPAERRVSREDYISMWSDEAQRHMLEYGIPASITLAQGILESANGNSALAKYANNHFGIKCHGWTGGTFYQDDDAKDECFRKYRNAKESYEDHAKFLAHRGRYSFLFEYSSTDYKKWAHGLKKAGYATNPKYAYLLIDLIEQYNLDQYDQIDNVPKPEFVEYQAEAELFNRAKPIRHAVRVHDNKREYIIAKSGDTFYKISKEFDMNLWQIYKYNDLGQQDILKPGDIVYLQPKRNRAQVDWHTVSKGQTMREISQIYGIKLKKLYRKNNMDYRKREQPEVGQRLSLRKKIR